MSVSTAVTEHSRCADANAAQPLVSIVTPFYNTAAYLRECIESVLAQSYTRFELILQDNASDDGSAEIAREFASRDSRVKYVRLERLLPQVANYNLALSRIDPASAYCKIVQADDWIVRECLSKMVELAERSSRVGIVSSFRLRGKEVAGEGLSYSQEFLPGRVAAKLHLLTPCFLFGSPTTLMFRSRIVRERQPFYAENRLHEDTEACYEILRDWDFGFVHQILSFSRMNDDSTYGRVRNYDAGVLDKMIVLRRYGREFLTGSEFEIRMREVEQRYYRRLAYSALCARGEGYWSYQRRGLNTQGPGIERVKFVRAMGRELLSLLARPHQIVDIVKSWKGA